MKHTITTPSGKDYADVWKEGGKLCIQLWNARLLGSAPVIHMDEKCIPHLQRIFEAMNTEDDEFNRIERESKQRMQAVEYSIYKDLVAQVMVGFREKIQDLRNTPTAFKVAKRKQIINDLDDLLKKF